MFTVAANLNTAGFCGHSLIADPLGRAMTEAGHDVTLRSRLDLSLIASERLREPALALGQPDVCELRR